LSRTAATSKAGRGPLARCNGRPNKPLELTPLCGPEIAAILEAGKRSNAFAI